DSMERDIGIAVPRESALVLDVYAAQPQAFAFDQSMDVEAGSAARGDCRRHEVLREGQFAKPLVAFDQRDGEAGGQSHLGIVPCRGSIAPSVMRGQDVGIAK